MLFASVAAFGQGASLAPESTVTWKVAASELEGGNYRITFSGKVIEGWHTYSLTSKANKLEIEFDDTDGVSVDGLPYELTKTKSVDGLTVFFDKFAVAQNVTLTGTPKTVKGTLSWFSCNDQVCGTREYYDFSVDVKATKAANVASGQTEAGDGSSDTSAIAENTENNLVAEPTEAAIAHGMTEESEKAGGSIWSLIIEAILWGFAMLLTPCVFPMVPMTISFFMKGSSTPAGGRFKAIMYGIFIILLYTVPISVIILITLLVGGDAVTADIFNWLATSWLPNILFFIIFMIFAASFFGAFEITLPNSLVNKSDKNSDKKGLLGVFFMALTLVLVSFSCTGPIVGSVLIKSTQGEFWTPMITMLAFSTAFALPFTILAMFPSLLDKMKSGSWLNSVKVVLGFIEVALGFKFLSVADQTYHWGLLDREIYLAIWIVVFTLLGLYLLGKIRFANDDKVEHIGVFRLVLVIIDFTFVVYLIPGMFGAPLKALSGYLPPMETQDFIVLNNGNAGASGSAATIDIAQAQASDNEYNLKMPLGLSGYFSLEDGFNAAKKAGKPVFVDITGHGCVNCREMEARVWSDQKVLQMLRDEFVIVALYTDDKTKLKEKDWIKAENGKVLKDLGRANSYIVRERFGVNAQPNYAILTPEGEQLVPIRGYNLSVEGFIAFLQSGIDAFNSKTK